MGVQFNVRFILSLICAVNMLNAQSTEGATEVGSICSTENLQYIRRQKAQLRSTRQVFDSTKGSQVHVFGEIHGHTRTDRILRLTLELFEAERNLRLSNPVPRGALNLEPQLCLLLETPPRGLELYAQIRRAENKLPPEQRNRVHLQFANYYLELAEIANKASVRPLKLIEIGHPANLTDTVQDDLLRRRYMAGKIDRLIRSKTCDTALVIIGKSHVSPFRHLEPGLPQLLKEEGLTAATYNISDEAYRTDSNFLGWQSLPCAKELGGIAAIESSRLPVAAPLYPQLSTQKPMLWNEFDYAIIGP